MVTVTQSTPRTVTSKTGLVLPATITPQTDLNTGIAAMATYYRLAGGEGSWATAMSVVTAMQDSSAVVVLYVGLDGGQDARVLWPLAITITKENKIAVRAYCTLRRMVKTFRMDRILTCHALTTPDDIEQTSAAGRKGA